MTQARPHRHREPTTGVRVDLELGALKAVLGLLHTLPPEGGRHLVGSIVAAGGKRVGSASYKSTLSVPTSLTMYSRRQPAFGSGREKVPSRAMRIRALCLVSFLALTCGNGARTGSLSPGDILAALGARGREGRSAEQLDAYRQTFGFLDADGSGGVTVQEYVANSIFPNPTSARGVFAATDRDGSGTVTIDEYVENRIITDEANEIFFALDTDDDGRVTPAELGDGSPFEGDQLSDVFRRFDTSMDGAIEQVELLRVWGDWARL